MKKILLSVAFLFATFVGANAQEISFESSEGYNLGDITGQNGWGTNLAALPGGPNDPTIDVVSTLSTEGDNSLYFQGTDNPYPDGGTPPQAFLIGAFSPTLAISSDVFEVSFDLYATELIAGASDASDIHILTQSVGEQALTTRLVFTYQGSIFVLEPNGDSSYQATGASYNFATWYNVKILYDFANNSIKYYLNNDLIYDGVTWTDATTVDQIVFLFDNYGNGFYIDNIVINEDVNASTGDFTTSTFSVYPNPAKDIINISNSADAVENVTITDMNGRVVKNVTLGVNEGQINIADLSQGVYILNAVSNGKSFTQKIVKQ